MPNLPDGKAGSVSIASAPTEDIAANIKALLTKGVEQKVFQVKAVESNEAMINSARTNYFPNISATGLYNRTNRNIQLLENNMLIPVVPFSNINPETGEFYPKRDSTSTSVFNPISGGVNLRLGRQPRFHQLLRAA